MAITKEESSNWESQEIAGQLKYSKTDAGLVEFAAWLNSLQASARFKKFVNDLLEIDKKLETEPVGQKRTELVRRRFRLFNEI